MNFYHAIKACGKTDIGLFRDNNEDDYLIVDPDNEAYDILHHGLLFAVADGMGGHAAGEVASKMACQGLLDYYTYNTAHKAASGDPNLKLERLHRVIRKTNQDIHEYSRRHQHVLGMGTTLSVLILSPETAIIGHVGDSRIYRFRNQTLKRLTTDHTSVQEMIDMGLLTPDEAANHPLRHVLLQAVGTESELKNIGTAIQPVEPGDVYLLSTDGLHDCIGDTAIEQTLREIEEVEAACNRMVEQALKKGGRDNITLIIVMIPRGK